jgi:hypothetical protein
MQLEDRPVTCTAACDVTRLRSRGSLRRRWSTDRQRNVFSLCSRLLSMVLEAEMDEPSPGFRRGGSRRRVEVEFRVIDLVQ